MSRAEAERADAASTNQNAGYYQESQNSYANANNDINDYKDQLAKYASSNPYGQGGQFQTSTNQVLANTSDAGARAAGEALQSQAERTGQNTAGGIAATEKMEQQGTRNLSGEEAQANQQRIEGGAGYNKSVLQATDVPAQFASQMTKNMTDASNSALGSMVKAADWTDPAANIWNKAGADAATGFAGAEEKANI